MFVTVTAPTGSKPGDTMNLQTPDGAMFMATIPPGVQPGQDFQVPITSGTPIETTPLSGQKRYNGRPTYHKYGYLESVHGDGPVEGQGLSCCLIISHVILFVLCLCLSMNVTYYFQQICNWCQRCCWYTTTCCYPTSWLSYNPLTADFLPFNNASGVSNAPNGNGHADYWSLSVAVGCGCTACLLVICCVAPAAVRRGGPAPAIGFGNLFALCLHITVITCLAVELISDKDSQWVYNPFCGNAGGLANTNGLRCNTENYIELRGNSVANYWINNYYLGWYGNLVYWVFGMSCVAAFECVIFLILCFVTDESTGERYSGTRRSFRDDVGWGW